MSNLVDITNQKFGRLTAVRRSAMRSKDGRIQWECLCECGAAVVVRGSNLRRGNTRSCGCLHVEAARLTGRVLGLIYGPQNGKRAAAAYRSARMQSRRETGAKHKHLNGDGTQKAKALLRRLGL